MALWAKRVGLIHTENAFKIGPYIKQVEASGPGPKVIRCNVGEPDFKTPAHIRDEIKRQLDLDNTHYSDPQGILSLRVAIAEHIGKTRGLDISPERVVVFPGGKPPIGFAELCYCEEGDEIIYPSPGYPIYESFTRYVGATPVPLHLKEELGFAFTGEQLAALITPRTKLIIMNFPSNPTGGVASREQIEGIARVINEKCSDDVRVFTDEIYEDFLYDGAEHVSPASMPGMSNKTIIVSGASKAYSFTGGRVGWAVFPTVEEAKVFTNMNINYFTCLSPYTMEGTRVALTDPRTRTFIGEMSAAFQRRRDLVVRGLNAIDGVRCQAPRGAFYVFPNVAGVCARIGAIEAFDRLPASDRGRSSPATLLQLFLLFRYRLAVLDRRSFGSIGAEGQHFLRFSIATGEQDLADGLLRFGAAASDTKGFQEFMKTGPYF